MHFVDDDNPVFRRCGQKADFFLELADLLNPSIGGAVDLVEVKRRTGSDGLAGLTAIAGVQGRAVFTVDGLGHDPSQGGLADTPDA